MRTLTLVVTCLLLFSFRMPTVEVAIKGHLRSKSNKNVGKKTVFVKGAIRNGLGIAETAKNGDFMLAFDISYSDESPLSFYWIDDRKDTILLKKVAKLTSDTPEMTFWIR